MHPKEFSKYIVVVTDIYDTYFKKTQQLFIENKSKTSSELLTKKFHPHWLEMLGFNTVQVAA